MLEINVIFILASGFVGAIIYIVKDGDTHKWHIKHPKIFTVAKRILIPSYITLFFLSLGTTIKENMDNKDEADSLNKNLNALQKELVNAQNQLNGQNSYPKLTFLRRHPEEVVGIIAIDNSLGEDPAYSIDGYFVKQVDGHSVHLQKFGPLDIPPKSKLLQTYPFPMKEDESIIIQASFTTRTGFYNQTLFIEKVGKENYRQAHLLSSNLDTLNYKYEVEDGFPIEKVPALSIVKDLLTNRSNPVIP